MSDSITCIPGLTNTMHLLQYQKAQKGTASGKHRKGVSQTCGWKGYHTTETGRTFCGLIAKRHSYSVCSASSFKCYVRTRKLSSLTGMLSTQLLQDLHILAPCSHEDPNSRMLLNVSHVALNGHYHILICTVDTDIVVLAVFAIS